MQNYVNPVADARRSYLKLVFLRYTREVGEGLEENKCRGPMWSDKRKREGARRACFVFISQDGSRTMKRCHVFCNISSHRILTLMLCGQIAYYMIKNLAGLCPCS